MLCCVLLCACDEAHLTLRHSEEAERQRALDAEMSRLQAEEEAQARQMQALAEEERRRQEQEAEEVR